MRSFQPHCEDVPWGRLIANATNEASVQLKVTVRNEKYLDESLNSSGKGAGAIAGLEQMQRTVRLTLSWNSILLRFDK